MRKIILASLFLIAITLGFVSFLLVKKLTAPQKTHYHAGFIVFQNNKKLNFSDNKFMFIKPCVLNEDNDDSDKDVQFEKAHLHDNVGDLVHVEATGAIWKDLFTNMRFPIDYAKTTGYINSKKIVNYQKQPIRPYESLVVFIGENDPKFQSLGVTKDYMIKMAKKSTTCGD